MTLEKIKLNFEDWGEGFSLLGNISEEVWETGEEDYDLGDLSLRDKKGRVFFLEDTLKESFHKAFEYYIKEARRLNIPGRYDVPELGLKDVSFVEVLEAIRDYYVRKFSQAKKSSKVPAAA